jgi:hypothetical protein
VLPAFSYASAWAGVSQMLARYSIGNTNPFSFKRPVVPENESFVAAVSWAEDPYVFRYKLSDLGVLYFPVYDGGQIGANAYLEIWDVTGSSLASITDDWILQASKLIVPDICNCLLVYELTQAQYVDTPVLPAYAYCNIFCDPLCST